MKIYIFRHGIAEDYRPEGDSARELTKEGEKKVEAVSTFLHGKISPQVFLTSPYVRAVQTAEIVKKILAPKLKIELADFLLPEMTSTDTISEIEGRDAESIILFGHNPHLSYLVSDVISGGAADIQLKKASVTAIAFDGTPRLSAGILKWMITPGVLGL